MSGWKSVRFAINYREQLMLRGWKVRVARWMFVKQPRHDEDYLVCSLAHLDCFSSPTSVCTSVIHLARQLQPALDLGYHFLMHISPLHLILALSHRIGIP